MLRIPKMPMVEAVESGSQRKTPLLGGDLILLTGEGYILNSHLPTQTTPEIGKTGRDDT